MKKIINKIEVLIILLFSMNSFSEKNYGHQQYEQIIEVLTEINNTRNKAPTIIPLKINKTVDDLGFILYDLVNRQKFQQIDRILPDYLNDENHDKGMLDYISAERAYFNGDYPLALKFYLKIFPVISFICYLTWHIKIKLSLVNEHHVQAMILITV